MGRGAKKDLRDIHFSSLNRTLYHLDYKPPTRGTIKDPIQSTRQLNILLDPLEMPVLSETVLVRDESHQGLELSHEDSLVGSTNTVSTNSKVVNKLDKQSASLLKRSSSFAERDTTIDDLHQNDVVHEPIVALDLLWSWYLPLLMMWFRRSLFGTSYLIRSVLIGQCIRLLLTSATGSVDTTLPKWVILLTDPHAWPPPALTLLAIFTILALIVHPDGLTWFMLGKVR